MKSWKTSTLATLALLWGTSAIAAQPIGTAQSPSVKNHPAASLSLTRAGPKMRGASKLDGGPLTIALIAAGLVAAYFFYTEVIDDDNDEPSSP